MDGFDCGFDTSGLYVDPTSFPGPSGTQMFTDNTQVVYDISAAQNNTLLFNSTAASYYDNQQALTLQPIYPVPTDGSTINIDIPDHMLSSALSPSNQRPQATGTNPVSKPQALSPSANHIPIALAAQPRYQLSAAAPAPCFTQPLPTGTRLPIATPLHALTHNPAAVDCPVCLQRHLTYTRKAFSKTSQLSMSYSPEEMDR
jgi:hypothetical protein